MISTLARGEKAKVGEEAKRREAITKSIEQQKELIKRFEEEEKRYANIARLILEHMDKLNLILSYAKSKKRFGIEELKRFEDLSGDSRYRFKEQKDKGKNKRII